MDLDTLQNTEVLDQSYWGIGRGSSRLTSFVRDFLLI